MSTETHFRGVISQGTWDTSLRAARIAGWFALFLVGWVVITDLVPAFVLPEIAAWRWWQILSRAVLILAGGALLFGWVRALLRKIADDGRELVERERRYAAAFEEGAVGLAMVSPEGEVIQCNDRFCGLLGYSRKELLGKSFQTVPHVSPPEGEDRQVKRLFAGESSELSWEKRWVRADGGATWAHLTMRTVRTESGATEYLLVILQDITTQKRLEGEVAEGEARWRILTEQSITGIYLVVDGRFAFVNQRLAEIYGYTPEELIEKRRLIELVAEQDREKVGEQIRQRLFGEIPSSHYTLRGLRRDGSIVMVEVQGRVLMHRGRPALLGTLMDLTPLHRAADVLHQRDERYKALMHALPDLPLILLNPHGLIEDLNSAALSLSGHQAGELQGRPFEVLFTEEDIVAGKPARALAQALAAGVSREDCERVRRDGSRFPAEGTIVCLRDDKGELLGFASMVRAGV